MIKYIVNINFCTETLNYKFEGPVEASTSVNREAVKPICNFFKSGHIHNLQNCDKKSSEICIFGQDMMP